MTSRMAGRERGSATIEMTILSASVLMPLLFFVIFCGRISSVSGDVQSAARMAARAATLERTVGGQNARGNEAAQQRLQQSGIECSGGPQVQVNVIDYQGRSGLASVTVRCTVQYDQYGFPGLPGSHTFEGGFTEFFDVRRDSE
jgi:Flp pilus assembly protein TadG